MFQVDRGLSHRGEAGSMALGGTVLICNLVASLSSCGTRKVVQALPLSSIFSGVKAELITCHMEFFVRIK